MQYHQGTTGHPLTHVSNALQCSQGRLYMYVCINMYACTYVYVYDMVDEQSHA